LEYKPGATNHADALSHQPNYNTGNQDNKNITAWPDKYFCNYHMAICVLDTDSIKQWICLEQSANQLKLKNWAPIHNLALIDDAYSTH
jgi:hypothetical protein